MQKRPCLSRLWTSVVGTLGQGGLDPLFVPCHDGSLGRATSCFCPHESNVVCCMKTDHRLDCLDITSHSSHDSAQIVALKSFRANSAKAKQEKNNVLG